MTDLSLSYTSYAVPHSNTFKPAAAWCFPFYLCFGFALVERKNRNTKKIKYRLTLFIHFQQGSDQGQPGFLRLLLKGDAQAPTIPL